MTTTLGNSLSTAALLGSLATAGSLLLAPLPGQAAVLDQSNLQPPVLYSLISGSSDFRRVQTFTVGVSGTLESVVVELLANLPPLRLDIVGTIGGIPVFGFPEISILASSSSFTRTGDLYRFDFSGANLQVNKNDVLAIEPVSQANATLAVWGASRGNPYLGGTPYFVEPSRGVTLATPSPDLDFNFQTFVTPAPVDPPTPVPTPALLPGLVGLGLGLWRQRSAS